MEGKTNTYKDLIVWQRSMELVVKIYELVKLFPDSEKFGLTSQVRRAAVSIPANIAEGRVRSSRKDYYRFIIMAYSSGAELETEIEIAKRLHFIELSNFQEVDSLLNEVMRMLNTMRYKLRS